MNKRTKYVFIQIVINTPHQRIAILFKYFFRKFIHFPYFQQIFQASPFGVNYFQHAIMYNKKKLMFVILCFMQSFMFTEVL